MIVSQEAFRGDQAGTVSITPTSTSQAVQILESALVYRHVRVVNESGQTVFIEFGGPSVVASVATGMPILADEVDVFSIVGQSGGGYVAAIARNSSATLPVFFTPGEGMD